MEAFRKKWTIENWKIKLFIGLCGRSIGAWSINAYLDELTFKCKVLLNFEGFRLDLFDTGNRLCTKHVLMHLCSTNQFSL